MPTPPLSDEDCIEALNGLARFGGNESQAAIGMGISRGTLQGRLRLARARGLIAGPLVPTADPLPEADIPTEEIIASMRQRFERRAANAAARQWREFRVPTSGPYALMLFGDPHVDDDGCNWGLLEAHCKLARETQHLYGISVGDQSIVCVVDPDAGKLNALTCFADPYEGADFLRFKRRKAAA